MDNELLSIAVISTLVVILAMTALFYLIKRLLFSQKIKVGENQAMTILESEVDRSMRYKRCFGVLLLEVDAKSKRGLHNLLPGKTIKVEKLSEKVRKFDVVIQTDVRLYTVILPESQTKKGPEIVKQRLLQTINEEGWKVARVGMANFPVEGDTADLLLELAKDDMEKQEFTS